MNLEKLQDNTRRASGLLKAMSNEHRLLILCQLEGGEKSVGELVRLVGLSQSALSQHLARLRRDSLVRTRREAQTIFSHSAGLCERPIPRFLASLRRKLVPERGEAATAPHP